MFQLNCWYVVVLSHGMILQLVTVPVSCHNKYYPTVALFLKTIDTYAKLSNPRVYALPQHLLLTPTAPVSHRPGFQ